MSLAPERLPGATIIGVVVAGAWLRLQGNGDALAPPELGTAQARAGSLASRRRWRRT